MQDTRAVETEDEKQINSLLRDGSIVPSCSPMISSLFVLSNRILFKTGSMHVRTVRDLRYLNTFTQVDPHPVAKLNEILT